MPRACGFRKYQFENRSWEGFLPTSWPHFLKNSLISSDNNKKDLGPLAQVLKNIAMPHHAEGRVDPKSR
jgi:hypothetical protein